MCCAFEAAGAESLCENGACHSPEEEAPVDGCNVVESGDYQSVVSTIKAAPVASFVWACLFFLQSATAQSRELECSALRELDRPRDWTVSWHFDRRAAALAHAPDFLLA